MKLKLTALLFIAAFMTAFSSHAATLAGKHYEGIGKVAGQAIDFWVTIDFDDEDAEYKVAGAFNISGAYTVSKTAAATTVSVKSPGGKTNTLKSTDGGSSFEGSVTLNGKVVKLWVLEVPASHKACDLPAAELTNVIASTEGYTSFIRVNLPNGAQMCVTSDFKFNADGTYTLTCDTPAIQKIFGNMKGTFKVSGSEITLTDATGKIVTGKVYDNGIYISIPFGTAQGMTLSMVLIR